MDSNSQHAQYTCDSCYLRKIKCSKELPVCASCQQLSTECIYSRAGVIHRRKKRRKSLGSNASDHQNQPSVTGSNDQRVISSDTAVSVSDELGTRLNSIESSISKLAETVTSLSEAVSQRHPRPSRTLEDDPNSDSLFHRIPQVPVRPKSSARKRDQHSKASDRNPSQLHEDINALSGLLGNTPKNGHSSINSISSLSNIYSAFWQDEEFVKLAQPNMDRHGSFFSLSEYQELAPTFELVMQKSGGMLPTASPDLVRDLVHEPWKVEEKGWLIIFNGVLLTAMRSSGATDVLLHKLKWNIWSALNDARLLLEPKDLNIHAMMLLGCHVQDFMTPSLSWMLINNACRMFQLIHTAPNRGDEGPLSTEDFLFWALNAMDKGLALIFGRAPSLTGEPYDNVFVPDVSRLLFFHPHLGSMNTGYSVDLRANNASRTFGAHTLRQAFLCSRIVGRMWRHLHMEDDSVPKDVLRRTLDGWRTKTIQVLTEAMELERPISTEEEIAAMELGIDHAKFQYYYLVVILTRNDEDEGCLEAARSALSLVKNLISDANDVYNGVSWQLLYCPFTPLLIVVRHVLSSNDTGPDEADIQILTRTVEYYEAMNTKHPQAGALLNTARSLLNLVLSHNNKRRSALNDLNIAGMAQHDLTVEHGLSSGQQSWGSGHMPNTRNRAQQGRSDGSTSTPQYGHLSALADSPSQIQAANSGNNQAQQSTGRQNMLYSWNDNQHIDTTNTLASLGSMFSQSNTVTAPPPAIFDWFAWEHWQNHLPSF